MNANTDSTFHAWPIKQIVSLFQRRPELLTKEINLVLKKDQKLRWLIVVELYLAQEISLAKTANLLDMHMLEIRQRFQNMGIPIYTGPADLADAKAEVEVMKQIAMY